MTQLPNPLGQQKLLLCEGSLLLVFVGFENLQENLNLIDKQLQRRSFVSFIFWYKFYLLGLFQRFLASLYFFCCQQTMMPYIFTQPLHHKKASCSPVCLYFTTTSTQLTASKTQELASQLPPSYLAQLAKYLA